MLGVAAIVLAGLALRTILVGSTPFENGDDVSTAWATTWYYPRDWPRMLRIGQGSVEPNPIGIITLTHGPLQAVIGYLWVTVVASFGIHITEFIWHLPFALLGSMAVFMIYVLGSALQGRRAGILAAVFASVLPLHIAFSRTSGESHYILASLLQVTSIFLWVRYLETGRKSLALATGLAVALDVLTDFGFVGLVLTLIFISLVHQLALGARPAIKPILSGVLHWRLILPILPAVAVQVYALVQGIRLNQPAGMLGRLLSQEQSTHTSVGGFFSAPGAAKPCRRYEPVRDVGCRSQRHPFPQHEENPHHRCKHNPVLGLHLSLALCGPFLSSRLDWQFHSHRCGACPIRLFHSG